MFDLRTVAHALGGEITAGQVIAPGPRHSRKDRSLSIHLDANAPDGFRVHSFAGDDWRDCRDYVRERLGLPRDTDPRRVQEPRWPAPSAASAKPQPDPEKVSQARTLWREGCDPRETLVERYLNSRGLALDGGIAGSILRWHSSANALMALFRNAHSGQPQAISRTYLDLNARKISRKFLGPVGHAAIQFEQPSDELTVAEGIESAMTARAFGMGPTWATGSAGAIAALPLITGVKLLRICVERDENGASERAALVCAQRWQAAGRKVTFKLPPPYCKDLNDAIRSNQQ